MKKKLLIVLLLFVTVFLITGCNSKKKDSNQKEESNSSTEAVSENVNADIELYSDSKKIVFEGANMRYVFYRDGEKITGYHLYIDYESAALAKVALDQYNAQQDESIDKVYTKGKYVVIEYAKSQYQDLTVTLVKQVYSSFKEVKKS